MKHFKKILAPTDFSEYSDEGLRDRVQMDVCKIAPALYPYTAIRVSTVLT